MKLGELLKTIRKGESEQLELKPSFSQVNEIIETVSAFSNKSGGSVIVRVSGSGKILGLQIGEDTIERLCNKIKDSTEPAVYPKILVQEIYGKKIVAIEVGESAEKPVLAFGRAFKRVGRSTLKVEKDEHEKMVLEKKKVYFDSLPCKGAALKDIDWAFVNKFFIPKYESIAKAKLAGKPEDLLETLGCIKNSMPTNAGILLFGKNPQIFFMNAYIALARYKEGIGTERLDYKEFDGNIFLQIDKSWEYIKEHIAVMSMLDPLKVEREDISEYPLFSIRELVVNAVCHRDYSEQGSKAIIKMFDDCIEFYNPGGLAKDITPENIAQKQFSRNPVIAKALSKIRYIEELGEGWDKIIKEHKKHPLKPRLPKISADRSSMLVTLFSTKAKFEEKKEALALNERQKRILNRLKKEGMITTGICAKLLGVSSDTALRELSHLKTLSLIRQKGVGRGLYYVIK